MPTYDKIAGTLEESFAIGVKGPNTHSLNNSAAGLSVVDEVGDPAPIYASNNGKVERQFFNFPEAPGNTVQFRGWADYPCIVTRITLYCYTVNTVGTLTLTATNRATGNTMLNAATFDLNTLVADTPTPLTLTSTEADLTFNTDDKWLFSIASDDTGMDATGIYLGVLFEAT
jgi:hypothetical protein